MIAESNEPIDFYNGKLDGHAAFEVLKVAGIATQYRVALNQQMLIKAINEAVERDVNIFHLSSHGNDDGVGLTDDNFIDWADLSDLFQPFARPERMLVYASCGGGHINAAKAFAKQENKFGFICGSSNADGVGFYESCIAWSILYNKIAEKNEIAPPSIMLTIAKINMVIDGNFVYREWDNKISRYRAFPLPKKEEIKYDEQN